MEILLFNLSCWDFLDQLFFSKPTVNRVFVTRTIYCIFFSFRFVQGDDDVEVFWAFKQEKVITLKNMQKIYNEAKPKTLV